VGWSVFVSASKGAGGGFGVNADAPALVVDSHQVLVPIHPHLLSLADVK
jgi:hypothetical protein